VALLVDASGRLVKRLEVGPANLRLLTDSRFKSLLRSLARQCPRPSALGIGLAGARTAADRERIRRAAHTVWPGVPCHATHDLETALQAALRTDLRSAAKRNQVTRSSPPDGGARVLVLCGTGSCCYGRRADGTEVRTGGWGHLLGDRGSGYAIALEALRDTLRRYDHTKQWPRLGQRILRRLALNTPEELLGWIQGAGKDEVASLAPEVFAAAAKGDRPARTVLANAAGSLAADALTCARSLVSPRGAVNFVLAGSVLLRQPAFARKVAQAIRAARPRASVALLRRESAWGAVELARDLAAPGSASGSAPRPCADFRRPTSSLRQGAAFPSVGSLADSPTERRNPRSRNLDRLPLAQAIDLMLSESARILPALRVERARLETAVRWIVRALRSGGRLFYVGAGTSGRLGVLDASECPPTFRTPPDLVQGVIAGGQTALWRSVEGAEDNAVLGAEAVTFRGVGSPDVVVGIAASGRTPFVWGALREARRRGARTILLCFNPHLAIPPRQRPHLILAPDLGPEVLTGSTRLNAGTATKIVLNLFTTLAMVRLGKVVSNLMVNLNPSNAKLRDRAVRIVRELTGANADRAHAALVETGWDVKRALRWLGRPQHCQEAGRDFRGVRFTRIGPDGQAEQGSAG
jgi:N-acetylmuramic acid 6-phosphate etherase